MQTYLVRNNKNICFIIFHPCQDNFVYPREFYRDWEILSSLNNFIHEQFYLAQRNFIQRREFGDFYPVQRLLSNAQAFVYSGDCYPGWRFLSIEETFIQFGDFTQCGDFYPVGDFYSVWRLLCRVEILFSVETFIQYGDFYLVWRLWL